MRLQARPSRFGGQGAAENVRKVLPAGWPGNGACWPFRARLTNDPRFKFFSDLPEDSYEAFLSAPVIARNRVVGVINVQHRMAHFHSGDEMEMLTTVGEQVGCLLVLSRMAATAVEETNHVELVLSSSASSTK